MFSFNFGEIPDNISNGGEYLVGTTISDVLKYAQEPFNPPEDCNVVSVDRMGRLNYFQVCRNIPPNRLVKVFVNNSVSTLDVVDVFKYIQSQAVAWAEI